MITKDIRVVFNLISRQFGVSAEDVLEMTILPACTFTPSMPKFVRGVVNLRGRVLPVLDLRVMMGMTSATSERDSLIEMLKQREEDHRRWIKELEDAVREGREFKLTTDPTKCAFGKWYYAFNTADAALKYLLGKFEEPHRQIHELGKTVLRLSGEGLKEEALKLIESAHDNTMRYLLDLFEELYRSIRADSREIGIVMTSEGRSAIFAVDSVLAVETLAESSAESFAETMSGLKSDQSIVGIGKRKGNQSLVFLFDAKSLLEHARGVHA